MLVTPETAVNSNAMMSPAEIDVVVKSLTVVLSIAVPVDIETPDVLMELAEVGAVVPEATFHVLTVAVPALTTMLHPVIVPATGDT